MDAPIWSYVSPEEKELIEWAASTEGRSLSSWIADVCLERANELARIHKRLTAGARPSPAEVLERIRQSGKSKESGH